MLDLLLSIKTLISKNTLKLYQQLNLKKFRQKYGLFVVEGLKSVNELLNSSYEVEHIVCTENIQYQSIDIQASKISILTEKDFAKLSNLKNPQGILAIVHIKKHSAVKSDWSLALDEIKDPGNLGTIIRIADWYGIKNIYCSETTVDIYNPKVIQASMGSFVRLNLVYCNLLEALEGKNVYATVLDGENIRSLGPQKGGVLLIGNEANGISTSLLQKIKHKPISIPGDTSTESLNAAVATAICCERLLF